MWGINKKLAVLESRGEKIQASIVGAGQMGRGMVSQMMLMKGMKPAIVVDINPELAKTAYLHAGLKEDDIKFVKTISEANSWMEQGKYIYTDDADIAAKANLVQVAIDATGVPEVGAKFAVDSINNKKHIVMLNVETDVVIGPYLKQLADNAGIVYTGSAGDEPGAVMELFDFADALGFEVRAVGKGKNNPVDLECNPDSLYEYATGRGVSPKMQTAFSDGTKTMVEMTAMANATGFIPDVRGGHGAVGTAKELADIFRLKEEGGILNQYGIVDYINGVAPGVFVIVSTKLPDIKHEMEYLSMGSGPNYALYRPYHLTSLETPLSAALAVLDHQPTIVPTYGLVAETITVAKKDLKAGEMLDGIGGFTVYGTFEKADIAKQIGAVPLGLINKKTKLLKDVKKGELITYDMVELDQNSLIVQLRKLQDRFF
ncbi:NAD(P)H-dependent oxidoreductase [Sinanaerobacter chloroacetimidivorans]|jgi:predicted homoserine dehydrogenase-like protein|uniref:NAD(P)-dependent oxidoreductase n=1 Tax=Sinanaerobacter chloroacetimidivorans TaxID=2818044 RepID=A0A8J8B4D0_9FIRM|nr:SAF domain-containing protein [Sinanaerobacter chloroacetimidivorans]MBR0600607.1 NAD(P)-dependent oxidoreductase [Sinanaerobacter chloroacetimidivorans]